MNILDLTIVSSDGKYTILKIIMPKNTTFI